MILSSQLSTTATIPFFKTNSWKTRFSRGMVLPIIFLGLFLVLSQSASAATRVAKNPAINKASAKGVFSIAARGKDFKSDEEPVFNIKFQNPAAGQNFSKANIQVSHAYRKDVQEGTGQKFISLKIPDFEIIPESGGTFSVKIIKPRVFVPGTYRLTINSNGDTVTQDFSWGVLAFNINKATLQPGETGRLMFATLDNEGKTKCDSLVEADITAPDGKITHLSTKDKTISSDPKCADNVSADAPPDYEAYYKTGVPGIYNIVVHSKLKSEEEASPGHTIEDVFAADPNPLFTIERTGPTRIYPPTHYPVTITVTANQAYSGEVMEIAPAVFDLENISAGGVVTKNNDEKIIHWNVNLGKGQKTLLQYTFKAPDISPEFYLLGPLVFGGTAGTFQRPEYQEIRQWQIAADAATAVTCFWTGAVSSAWENKNNWQCQHGVNVDALYPNDITVPCANNKNCYYVAINRNANLPVQATTSIGLCALHIGTSTTASLKITDGATTKGSVFLRNVATYCADSVSGYGYGNNPRVGALQNYQYGTVYLDSNAANGCLITTERAATTTNLGIITSTVTSPNCTWDHNSNVNITNMGTMTGYWNFTLKGGFINTGVLNMVNGTASSTTNASNVISCANATSTRRNSAFYNYTADVNTTMTGGAGCYAGGTLTVNSGDTLTHGGGTLELANTGTPFSNSGTFTATSSSIVLYSGAGATNITNVSYNNLTLQPSSGSSQAYTWPSNIVNIWQNLTVGGGAGTTNVTIPSGAGASTTQLIVNTSNTLTNNGFATTTLAGTLDGIITGSGTTTWGNAVTACPAIPSGGTLSSNVRLEATGGNCTLTARTYGGNLEIHNGGATDRQIAIGAGTLAVNGAGGLTVDGESTGKIALDGSVNNPTVNITAGDIQYTGGGSGIQRIVTGSGNWVAAGNVKVTSNDLFYANADNFLTMTGTGKTLTLAATNTGSNFLRGFGASSTISISGNATTTNDFLIGTVGALSTPGTSSTLYISGNYRNYGGILNIKGGNIFIAGNFTQNGTTTGSGTTTFNGSSPQTLSGTMAGINKGFNNVEFSGAGAKTFSANASTTGNFIISGSAVNAPPYLSVGGNYYNNAGVFSAQNGTLIFNGLFQNIAGNLIDTSAFYRFIRSYFRARTDWRP